MVSRKWKEKASKRRKSWNGTLSEVLQNIEMTWNDFGEIADDHSYRGRAAVWRDVLPNVSKSMIILQSASPLGRSFEMARAGLVT